VWSTDSNGNFLSTLTPEVSGTDSRLTSLEPVFHQDLNGNGVVGSTSPASTALAAARDGFAFNFTQSATSSTILSELPDFMPAPAHEQAVPEHWIQPAGSQDMAVIDILTDFLHNLHDRGFLLG
jgi:serralysin